MPQAVTQEVLERPQLVPSAPMEPVEVVSAGEALAPPARFRILVVEDHTELRTFMMRLLEPNFDVSGAADGVDGWEMIQREPPDMVLSDVIMPRRDGVALLRLIRGEPELCTTPVILISARSDEDTRLQGLESGADDFLTKPFRSRELLALVSTQLQLVRVRRESAAQVAAVARQLSLQLDDMRQLHQFTERLSGVQPVDRMLREVLEASLAVHGACQGIVSLHDPARDRLEPGIYLGFREELLQLLQQTPENCRPASVAFTTRRRVVVMDFESDPAFTGFRPLARSAGVRAAHVTPMVTRTGKAIGTLTVFFASIHFPPERETQLMDLYARQAADLIDAAQLRERIETELTERTRAENALKENAEWLRLAIATGNVGLWEWDVLRDRIHWTDSVYGMHGVTREGFDGTFSGLMNLVHSADRLMVEQILLRALREKLPFDIEYRVRRPDGATVWLLTRGSVLTEDGKPSRILGGTLDVTLRRQADDSARFLAAIVESSEDAIYSKDASGAITSWNDSAERLLGYAGSEIIGQPAETLVPEAFAEKEARIDERVRRGERVPLFESVRQTRSGAWVPVSVKVSAVKDAMGRVIGASKIVRDITARKRTEEALTTSEERFRTLAEHAPVGIFLCNPRGECLFMNQRLHQMTGLTAQEWRGEQWSAIVHPEDRARFLNYWRNAVARKAESAIEYRTLDREGEVRWWESRAVAFRNNHAFVGFLGICIDVTESREWQLELERARDEAVAASRAKDDFLAALSHELRTPLNPVLLLASDAAANKDLAPEIREQFELIRSNVDLEARLIDDLLDLTRIARGKAPLEQRVIDLHLVLKDALAKIRNDQQTKRIELALQFHPENIQVLGDGIRLQQVFWNILKNAVKFTPAGGRIGVLTRSEPELSRVVIEISDSGIGMTAAEIGRAFDAFSQGEHGEGSGPHPFGGLGLGLAISQKLVEHHGGSICASSPGRGQGSNFSIKLPFLDAAAMEAAPPEVPNGSPLPPPTPNNAALGPPLRILLVEDHEPTRRTLEVLLQRRGHFIMTAATVAEALELAASHVYDLLISDVGLPDGDGHSLFVKLREQHPSLLGIALSGYGMGDDINRSEEAGFAAHLVKPVSIGALERAIARLGGQRKNS